MRRRQFLGVLGGAAIALPYPAVAQKALPRIGFLGSGAAASARRAKHLTIYRNAESSPPGKNIFLSENQKSCIVAPFRLDTRDVMAIRHQT
jgi:hypothetical protein